MRPSQHPTLDVRAPHRGANPMGIHVKGATIMFKDKASRKVRLRCESPILVEISSYTFMLRGWLTETTLSVPKPIDCTYVMQNYVDDCEHLLQVTLGS